MIGLLTLVRLQGEKRGDVTRPKNLAAATWRSKLGKTTDQTHNTAFSHCNVKQKVDDLTCRGTDLQQRATPELPKPKNPTQRMMTSLIASPPYNHRTLHDMHLLLNHGRTVVCTPMAQPRPKLQEDRETEDEYGVIHLGWTSRRSMRG